MASVLFTATEHSRFVFTAGDHGFGFHIEVRDGDAWRRVTAVDNPLVSGEAFNLRPTNVTASGAGLAMSGGRTDYAGRRYTWIGTVRPVPDASWFHVEVVLDSDGFPIGKGSIEPEISISLGDLPPYERGDHVWFKTLVTNPTQWNNEGRSNDFPAIYYYDPYLRAAFRMFFDMTAMSWMGEDTVARFYGYRCAFRRSYDGKPRAEIGLVADTQSGHDFPADKQVFSWYVSAAHLDGEPTPPSEQDALNELVTSCLPLLRSSANNWPTGSMTWREIADGCAADLMDTRHSWGADEEGEFLLAYVDGRSDAWAASLTARGREHAGIEPCLEAALWALRPVDALQASFADGRFADLQHRLEQFVRQEIRRDRCLMLSGVATTTTPMGSWQYIYMLAEMWFVFAHRDDRRLMAEIRDEIEQVAIPLAATTQYLFPLQFDKRTLTKIGPGSNYPVSGTYALLMSDLATRIGEARYLNEACNALRALANVPIDDALQEVVLMAHAVHAADRVHEITGDSTWLELRQYFRAQTLRMMYWYDDRTSERVAQASHLGMFLACANIGYPAFFENIETDARLAATIHAELDPSATLRVLDYGRRANFSFFARCSPAMYGPMPLEFIPFEDVPILEGPNNAGFLGQEIYGAGFAFLAHLLWDAYASAVNREVMVLNMYPYRQVEPGAPTWEGSFLLFNSTIEPVDTSIDFPVARRGDEVAVTLTTSDGTASSRIVGPRGLPVQLNAERWARMDVVVTKNTE